MREIKFRGKQINTHEWIYGYLYREKGFSHLPVKVVENKK